MISASASSRKLCVHTSSLSKVLATSSGLPAWPCSLLLVAMHLFLVALHLLLLVRHLLLEAMHYTFALLSNTDFLSVLRTKRPKGLRRAFCSSWLRAKTSGEAAFTAIKSKVLSFGVSSRS